MDTGIKKTDKPLGLLVWGILLFGIGILFLPWGNQWDAESVFLGLIISAWGISLYLGYFKKYARIRYLIWGILALITSANLFYSLYGNPNGYPYSDNLTALIWAAGLLILGISFCLNFFGKTLLGTIASIFATNTGSKALTIATRTVSLVFKIILWGIIAVIVILAVAGIISLISSISATAIIIFLLVMIYFKIK